MTSKKSDSMRESDNQTRLNKKHYLKPEFVDLGNIHKITRVDGEGSYPVTPLW